MQMATIRALAPITPVKFAAASSLEKLDTALRETLAAYERGAQRDQVLLIKVDFQHEPSRLERRRLADLKFHVFGQVGTNESYRLVGNLPLSSLRALAQSDEVARVEQAVGYEMYH